MIEELWRVDAANATIQTIISKGQGADFSEKIIFRAAWEISSDASKKIRKIANLFNQKDELRDHWWLWIYSSLYYYNYCKLRTDEWNEFLQNEPKNSASPFNWNDILSNLNNIHSGLIKASSSVKALGLNIGGTKQPGRTIYEQEISDFASEFYKCFEEQEAVSSVIQIGGGSSPGHTALWTQIYAVKLESQAQKVTDLISIVEGMKLSPGRAGTTDKDLPGLVQRLRPIWQQLRGKTPSFNFCEIRPSRVRAILPDLNLLFRNDPDDDSWADPGDDEFAFFVRALCLVLGMEPFSQAKLKKASDLLPR